MDDQLNSRALKLVERLSVDELHVATTQIEGGGTLLDFGVKSPGGVQAGSELARVCLADFAKVSLTAQLLFDMNWPTVQVSTDHPVLACLFSQYAGWQIKTDKFFAMGSGPMRAAAAREELLAKLGYREKSNRVVGVVETGKLPDAGVFQYIAERCDVPQENVTLLAASVCSTAGAFQVVARSVETVLHKLHELGFDVHRVRSGFGTAPLPPVAKDELTGIGRTNDAILYGGCVTLWVSGDDESLREIGPKVPSESSDCHGRRFLEIFEEAGRDFYKIDPHLFSPAVVVLQNVDTGNSFRFGHTAEDVLQKSFGM